MAKIVQKDDPVLRQTASPVAIEEIGSPRIQKIIADMKKALASQEDGVAIAAPQIGESLRIFVVAKRIFELLYGTDSAKQQKADLVFINPKIVKISRDKKALEEGCLSVRYLYGFVRRATRATVEAYNEKGEKFTRGGSGLLAQIFQHEIDHLNGILFIDNAINLRDLPPPSPKKEKTEPAEQPPAEAQA